MPDRDDRPRPGRATEVRVSPDTDTEPLAEPTPVPGSAGPLGGSPTGELVDGLNQPIDRPGERPPLSTD